MDTSIEVVTAPGEGTPSAEVDSQGDAAKLSGNKKPALPEKGQFGQNAMPSVQKALVPRARRGGGPRTRAGKERTRRNAVKHGILARVVVLEGESRSQFDSSLQGLRNDFQPEGTLENMLVEKLASLGWRYRRMLLAERAEIRIGIRRNPLTSEQEKQYREEAVALFGSMERPGPGLVSRSNNPIIRERIVDLLKTLSTIIEMRGFDQRADLDLLRVIFGERKLTSEMLWIYSICSSPGTLVKEEEFKEFDLPPAGRKAKFLEILKEYIARQELISKMSKGFSEWREKLDSVCSGIPEAPRLDRILRYEASLDRAFDRTLSQLERLQRIRRGQPVLPPIKIETT